MKNQKGLSLLLVDDHELILIGLKHLVKKSVPEITTIVSCSSGQEALAVLRQRQFDIYILDIELQDMTGLELISHIRQSNPDAPIIVNTMHEELWYIRKLKDLAVDGIVYKSIDSLQTVEAIRAVLSGKTYYCPATVKDEKALRKKVPHEGEALTRREYHILQCIAAGKSTADIADELYISVNTVETHRRHISEKLGATNVATLIMKAISKGFLTIE